MWAILLQNSERYDSECDYVARMTQKGAVETAAEKFSLIDFYLDVMQKEVLQAYVPADYRMMDVGKIGQIAEAEAFAERL